MKHWKEIKEVVVVGLGVTGLSVVKHLMSLEQNITIKVMDTRENPVGREELSSEIPLHVGSWNMEWLLNANLVVVNPGIALATPEIKKVKARGIPIVGDIELFAWAVNTPVIAITGSNGKSTVTDLTGVLAKACGINVGVGGNIGVPALALLEEPAELYILELSSFQLETTSSLKPVAAAFLNLSEDHMDRYDGIDSYRQAKLSIFQNSENVIVNSDDKATYPETLTTEQNRVRFGLQSGEFTVASIDGEDWLVDNLYGSGSILPVNALSLLGTHNIANVLAVFALLSCANIEYRKALPALKSYSGLTHRCQIVANNRGVKWVNDSKATNVASTIAALSGLDIEGTLHLLVGGVGKGADFSALAPELAKLSVKIYCFGEDGDKFMPLHPSATRWNSIDSIVEAIAPHLTSGDVVMLSPACASFDQFKNFMARGNAFTQLAKDYS